MLPVTFYTPVEEVRNTENDGYPSFYHILKGYVQIWNKPEKYWMVNTSCTLWNDDSGLFILVLIKKQQRHVPEGFCFWVPSTLKWLCGEQREGWALSSLRKWRADRASGCVRKRSWHCLFPFRQILSRNPAQLRKHLTASNTRPVHDF